jgi:hypothetical protein
MLIFWKERLVFLANTRTGSSSIERALEGLAAVTVMRPAALRHLAARDHAAHLAPLLAALGGGAFTTAAIVRAPIDWLGSWYRYRQRDDIPHAAGTSLGLSFEDFAERFLAGDVAGTVPAAADGQPAPPLGTQSDFLCGADGRVGVDRLFRYESIGRFVDFLDDRLGCDVTLPRLNVAPQGDLALPPTLRVRLAERFRRDAELHAAAEG